MSARTPAVRQLAFHREGGAARFLKPPSGALRWLLLALTCAGCSKDESTAPDRTPPSAVADLATLHVDETSVTLTWTAPGDDGSRDRASSYDIRYSQVSLPAGWDSATAVTGLAVPLESGLAETVTVFGLLRDRVYHLALKGRDDAGNESDLSNVVEAQPADLIPPAQVTDLRVIRVEQVAVVLVFSAPGDDGSTGSAAAYELRYGSSPVTEATWDAGTSFTIVQVPQPAGKTETVRVTGLAPEATVHFAVRARDDGGHWSPVSNDVGATLPGDTTAPGTIFDLTATCPEPFMVKLTWMAPGDDEWQGWASAYEVRYAGAAITEATWGAATPVPVSLTPKEAGGREELSIDGLPGNRWLWFCARAVDEKGNRSAVSNAAKVYVSRGSRVWIVRADGSGDAPTVQAGIDSSAGLGDTVLVAPGRYYEDIDFLGKGVVLKSLLGPEATILDGSREDSSVVMFFRDEPSSAVLEGFTITGGHGTGPDPEGGGIWCPTGSPRIAGNVITQNDAEWGGGVHIGASVARVARAPVIEGNRILENTASAGGGGVVIRGDSPRIIGNEIRGNRALGADGGGLDVLINQSGSLLLKENTIVDNVARDKGGGALVFLGRTTEAGPMTIQSNLFAGNVAKGLDVDDLGSGGGLYTLGGAGSIIRNTIVGNTGSEENPCSGGGIVISNSTGALEVAFNIIAHNVDCGLVCRGFGWARLGPNILWANTLSDLTPSCAELCVECDVADPLFCDPVRGDFRVKADSPALIDGRGVFGAFSTPGCEGELGQEPMLGRLVWSW